MAESFFAAGWIFFVILAFVVRRTKEIDRVFILRKQAEAVEAAVSELMPGHYGAPDDPSPEYIAACEMCSGFRDYAQRLRSQADELEKDND